MDETKEILISFSTIRFNGEDSLNEEVEIFLKNNAIQFAKEKKSITYLALDTKGTLLGYFTLAHKTIKIPRSSLSNTKRRMIERYSEFDEVLNAYPVSAFLIAQFGKNYALDEVQRISGNDLMHLADRELYEIQHRIGGGVKYLDCEDDAKLIIFYHNKHYFNLFGERLSHKDNRRYLQLMKFF
ncbi:MAG: GNAT family acetyltransferase [Faecalicoccus sp.]|nr:GNAT family acetyltransferase [Faecalicoccus sp.]